MPPERAGRELSNRGDRSRPRGPLAQRLCPRLASVSAHWRAHGHFHLPAAAKGVAVNFLPMCSGGRFSASGVREQTLWVPSSHVGNDAPGREDDEKGRGSTRRHGHGTGPGNRGHPGHHSA